MFIAVGTPSRRGDGYADLSYVYDATREIAPLVSANAVVITKSTVPVGTGDEVERLLREMRPEAELLRSFPIRNSCAKVQRSRTSSIPIALWSAPATQAGRTILAEIYRPLYLNAAPILYVSRQNR